MIDISEAELLELELTSNMLLFVYTPLCGTCKVAEQMLAIVEQTYPVVIFHRSNIQFMPHIRDTWQIRSVPCLIRIRQGERLPHVYAFHSISTLLETILPWLPKKE